MSLEIVEIGSKGGSDETAQQEVQRIRSVRFIARGALALSMLYALMYSLARYDFLAYYSVVFAVLYAAISALTRPSRVRVGGIVLMCAGFCQLAGLSVLFLPVSTGSHFYLMLIPIFSLIAIHPHDRGWWYALTGMSLVLMAGLEWQGEGWVPYIGLTGNVLPEEVSAWRASAIFLTVGFAFGVFRTFHRELHLARRDLHDSYERSESLLRNMLPESIARRLKREQQTIADSFGDASVLFADLVGFTTLAAGQSASETVTMLNAIFSDFDRAVADRGLEKIKTIGDAYMVAGGLPTPRPDHVTAILSLAQDLLEFVDRHNTLHGRSLGLRIGVCSGPLVAGVMGSHKLSYDIWGDTVNIASRMESTGVPGRIQVTEAVAKAAADHFSFEDRGMIDIKGKGQMRTFLLVAPL